MKAEADRAWAQEVSSRYVRDPQAELDAQEQQRRQQGVPRGAMGWISMLAGVCAHCQKKVSMGAKRCPHCHMNPHDSKQP